MLNAELSIGLIGFMGTGKTTVGKALASNLRREFIDTDEMIEIGEGKDVAGIFSHSGERYFREVEARVVREVCRKRSCVISFGGGALLNPSSAETIRRHTRVVLLTASVETIIKRIQPIETRPLLVHEQNTLKHRLEVLLAERNSGYNLAKSLEISTDSVTATEAARLIQWRLGL